MPARPREPGPRKPGPKPTVDCGTNLAPHIFGSHRTVGGTPTGGTITGTSITVNKEIKLTEALTLVAENDLEILDNISMAPGPLRSDLTLVSLHGTVRIASYASIGGYALAGKDEKSSVLYSHMVSAAAGNNGGFIKICGVNIMVSGRISGVRGGRGGNCTVSINQPLTAAPRPGRRPLSAGAEVRVGTCCSARKNQSWCTTEH